jgi:hypothetical protein
VPGPRREGDGQTGVGRISDSADRDATADRCGDAQLRRQPVFRDSADYDALTDVEQPARGTEAAVTRLVAISKRRKTPHTRGPLSLVV